MSKIPEIIFENSDFLVINKPSGLTVNKSETTRGQDTLQEWVEKKLEVKSEKLKVFEVSDFVKRAGIVHRLDKDTSGVMLVAKHEQAFIKLQSQFKEREVTKTYLALVWGELKEAGTVQAPIARNPFNRTKFGVFVGGREALTRYEIINTTKLKGEWVTLLSVTPLTGRTHQIRVHLQYIHHPIIGDELYSGRKLYRMAIEAVGRLMLHAWKISFADPGKRGHSLEFMARIPVQFKQFVPKNE